MRAAPTVNISSIPMLPLMSRTCRIRPAGRPVRVASQTRPESTDAPRWRMRWRSSRTSREYSGADGALPRVAAAMRVRPGGGRW
jgi:hypothetical protein